MKRKVLALVLMGILVGISMTACTRSATKNPDITEIPFPAGTSDPSTRLTEIILQTQAVLPGTQTAPGATTGTTDTTAGGSTVTVNIPTETPVPQPTATLPPIPTLERPATYTLHHGEWPICIARRYNLDMAGLLAANNLSLNSQPSAGAELKIPSDGTWNSGDRSLKAHPTNYTVQSGDSIYSIACDFGDVSPEGIAAANGLSDPYTIESGQTLRIP